MTRSDFIPNVHDPDRETDHGGLHAAKKLQSLHDSASSTNIGGDGLCGLPSDEDMRAIGVGDTIEIRRLSGFGEYNRGLFSRRAIQAGEVVMVGRRTLVTTRRTVYSVQVSMNPEVHIELDGVTKLANHSCDPNTAPRSNELGSYTWVALRSIEAGEEITWDYECTEYEVMSEALSKCLCGTKACRGAVVGYKTRGKIIRAKYGELVADYLKGLELS